ncbi:MAG TPA: nitroreductase [Acidimicrobiales bacterium]|nr:nitroreductase [Acidimicrobiales bacterium]
MDRPGLVNALDAIRQRRSIGRLSAPAPTDEHLREIFAAAVQAPDHGELRPWRFIVIRTEHMAAFGEILATAAIARGRASGIPPTEGQLTKERTKLGRAPLVVVAAAVKGPTDKIPWIEQQMAVAAAVENALLAATALGYGSMWRTGDPVYDPTVKAALGLGADDAVIGFLYLGTAPTGGSAPSFATRSTDTGAVVSEWRPAP